VEEGHGIGERILNEHALGITSDKRFWGGVGVVGDQDGRLIVAEIGDEELAIGALKQAGLLFEEARVAVFAMWDIELDSTPRRRRQVGDFGEQLGRAPAQRDEGDTLSIESIEPCIGGELGIEDEMLGRLAMLALPELCRPANYAEWVRFPQYSH
jgi:hypothetical protein